MTLELLLMRYPGFIRESQRISYEIEQDRNDIINSSAMGEGERVQTSGISDITARKALLIIDRTRAMERRRTILEGYIKTVQRAMFHLNPDEQEVIRRYFFKGESFERIQEKMGISERTISRKVKKAKEKMRPFVIDITNN